jgi:hypothetical protein
VLGEVTPGINTANTVIATVDDERRDAQIGQQRPYVLFVPRPDPFGGVIRAAGEPLTPSQPFPETVVASPTRSHEVHQRPGAPYFAGRS